MNLILKEKMNYADFMEANFPKVLRPFYKKRIIIVNLSFAVLYLMAAAYLFYTGLSKGIQLKAEHYVFLAFGLLFILLPIYLLRKEKKVYAEVFKQIQDLQTTYEIDNNQIRVKNPETDLTYQRKQIKELVELPKWFVFNFKNGERIAIHKDSFNKTQLDEFRQTYKIN